MRRPIFALAICASTLVLMAARCGDDEDDGIHIGAYPKVDGEDAGAGAAAPDDGAAAPDDGALSSDPTNPSEADPSVRSSPDADADAILNENGGAGEAAKKPPATRAAGKSAKSAKSAKPAAAEKAAPAIPKNDDELEPADDLFADPLDGANAGGGPKVDKGTMLDDQATFEPEGSGLPNAVGPDGDSLPQVPGPDGDMPDLGGPGMDSDLTE